MMDGEHPKFSRRFDVRKEIIDDGASVDSDAELTGDVPEHASFRLAHAYITRDDDAVERCLQFIHGIAGSPPRVRDQSGPDPCLTGVLYRGPHDVDSGPTNEETISKVGEVEPAVPSTIEQLRERFRELVIGKFTPFHLRDWVIANGVQVRLQDEIEHSPGRDTEFALEPRERVDVRRCENTTIINEKTVRSARSHQMSSFR